MDDSRDGLHLAHALPDGDALLACGKIAVHISPHGLDADGDGRGALQRLHERLIFLHVAGELFRQLRQGFSLRLGYVEYGDDLVHGDLDGLFLHDRVAVGVQHGELGVRVQLRFLDLLLVRRGRNDLDALFALPDISSEIVPPFVEAGHMSGVGLLHVDQHDVVDAVSVEPAHGGKVLPVLIRLEQLPDAGFNAVGDLFQPRFVLLGVALFFCHFDAPFQIKMRPCSGRWCPGQGRCVEKVTAF